MSRSLAYALTASVLLVLILAMVLRPREPWAVADRMSGDVEAELELLDTDEMPAMAEAFLATDRPWRAARVMRRYRERVGEMPADHRVLAARAEAGWGGWPAVRALLEGVPALDTHAGGIGLYLLGRARDEEGDPRRAVEAYRSFLALSPPAGEMTAEREAARLRLGLALIRSGDGPRGRSELAMAAGAVGGASVWLELLEADALAAVGDTSGVRQRVAGFTSGFGGLRAWRARIAAARAAGDRTAARSPAAAARGWAAQDATRAEFLVSAATDALAMGDTAAARAALRSAVDLGAAGPAPREAALLLRQGTMTPADHLAVARVDAAQGLHEEAAEGFRRWLAAAGASASEERAAVHLEHASALFYTQRYDQVAAALRPIAGRTEARLLRARTEAHLDNPDEAARIYLAVAEENAGRGTGAQSLFLAAATHHDAGSPRRAAELYRRVVTRYPGTSQMGLALMRLAGIAYLEGDHAEAARLWDQYRTRFPRGAQVLQATYWAGRARQEMGDADGAAGLFRTVRERQRDSYYALRASERLGVPFWPLPMRAAPADDAAAARRVAAWMRGIDLLRTAGFPDEASAEADRVVAAAGRDRGTSYALAEALAERGYTRRAIAIGQRLQAGAPPDRRLLRILYPFPYRQLITEEARDRGLDPMVTAALIRQESMFEARITSPAGARGLMQIMPATGRTLAEAVELEPWDAELLYHPEINVHLGTRYVAQHWENYDGSLPSVFAAYNAGWHRVEWWSEFPEYGDDELFTERIPFRETRDYVKILTRNRALYAGLYAPEG
jgi:soluble lytic murein transglycosylase